MNSQPPVDAASRVSIGPIHVELEEPIYFDIGVEGDYVKDMDVYPGHVHRGIEYLTTKRTVFQNVVLTERICSLCSNSHPSAFAMAIEEIADLEIPLRAEYLRVVADEIKRIASNLFNVGVLAHLVELKEIFVKVIEVREVAQDLKEGLFGNRMDLGAICIGGVRYDLEQKRLELLEASLAVLGPKIDEIIRIYTEDERILLRTKGVGVLTPAQARACGVVGPVARASGIPHDVRVMAPYAAYNRLDVPMSTLVEGDVWSRAIIRLREARSAVDLIRQALSDMPAGRTCLTGLPDIPPGRAISKTEAPRGELIYFVQTNDTENPERVKWRVPTYLNWEALRLMVKNAHVRDVTLIVNSIDPCVSCTDR